MAMQLSWLEQTVHTRQVSGSNPLIATINKTITKKGYSFYFFLINVDSKRRNRKSSSGRFSRRGSPNPLIATINKTITKKGYSFYFFLINVDSKRRNRKSSSGRFSRRGSPNPLIATMNQTITKKLQSFIVTSEVKWQYLTFSVKYCIILPVTYFICCLRFINVSEAQSSEQL